MELDGHGGSQYSCAGLSKGAHGSVGALLFVARLTDFAGRREGMPDRRAADEGRKP